MKIKMSLLALAFSLTTTALWAQDSFKTNDEGFIVNWLMLAPIPLEAENSGADAIDQKQVADEGNLKPKEGDKQKAGGKELTWKKVKAADYFFDVNELLGNMNENSVAYLVAYVTSDKEIKDAKLKMGSNDQGKIYVNGKELLKFAETRTLDKDTESADNVTLKKGVNVVVFKVINENNNWQGCARFTDKDGKPIKDLKIALVPEGKAAAPEKKN